MMREIEIVYGDKLIYQIHVPGRQSNKVKEKS